MSKPESSRSSMATACGVSCVCVAVAALTAVVAYDKLYWRLAQFGEGPPEFSFGRLLRSAVIGSSAALLCWNATRSIRSSSATEGHPDRWSRKERLAVIGVLFAAIFFLGVFLISPALFARLSVEDGPVEWTSAIMVFASSGVFAAGCLQRREPAVGFPRGACVTLVLFAAVFFVIGMEEVSWFQRVIGFETPEGFEANEQHELTLHNFATDIFEDLYYLGSAAFLVFWPFIRSSPLIPVRGRYVDLFTARPVISVVAAVACAYNYDMWNILFFQVAFYGAVALLLVYSLYASRGVERVITLSTVAVLIVTQLMFLTHGGNFSWLAQVTEYKELLIPTAFLFYALDVYRRIDDPGSR